MKCDYCGNKATIKGYRSWDGQTGSTRECEDCFGLNNLGVLKRHEIYKKAIEALPECDIQDIIDKAMDEFWGIVNEEISNDSETLLKQFKIDNGMELYENDLQAWKELMYEKISNTLKSQL